MQTNKDLKFILVLLALMVVLSIALVYTLKDTTHAEAASYGDTLPGLAAMGSSTVTTSSTAILATSTNPSYRSYAIIQNDGVNDVYLAIGQAAVKGQGILLKASGGTYEIKTDNLFTAAVYGIATSSTSNVTFLYR